MLRSTGSQVCNHRDTSGPTAFGHRCHAPIACLLLYTRRGSHFRSLHHRRSSFQARDRGHCDFRSIPKGLSLTSHHHVSASTSSRTQNQQLSSFCCWTLTLLCGAGAWSCLLTSDYNLRASLVLVAIEAVYVGLHIKPLMPLLGEGKADESSNKFMICYTTPHFFATEVLQFLVLLKTQAWSGIPSFMLWIHAAFHIVYTVLSGVFPTWSIQQNIKRVQGSRPKHTWRAAWDVLLNMLNIADALLHVIYIRLIIKAIHTSQRSQAYMSSAAVKLCITGFLLVGGALYYILGERVPNAVGLNGPSQSTPPEVAQTM